MTGWDAARYASEAAHVPNLALDLIDWLEPRPGETILDLGCGDGALSLRLAAGGARVIGLDSSPEMVAFARARGVDARLGNGTALVLEERCDAVFSNAALHWMPDAAAVCRSVALVLRPGGRFVAECGGLGNVETVCAPLRRALVRRGLDPEIGWPWLFASIGTYATHLEASGFVVRRAHLVDRPTELPHGLVAWLELFAPAILGRLPEAERPAAIAEVVAETAPHLQRADGSWWVDHVRLRFEAVLRHDAATAGPHSG